MGRNNTLLVPCSVDSYGAPTKHIIAAIDLATGMLNRSFGKNSDGIIGEDDLRYNISDLAVNSKGNIIVVQSERISPPGEKPRTRVVVFDSYGGGIDRSFGDDGVITPDAGKFDDPHGVAIDGEDNILITNEGNNTVSVLEPDGKKLNSDFGENSDGIIKVSKYNDESSLRGIAVGTGGSIWIAEGESSSVLKLSRVADESGDSPRDRSARLGQSPGSIDEDFDMPYKTATKKEVRGMVDRFRQSGNIGAEKTVLSAHFSPDKKVFIVVFCERNSTDNGEYVRYFDLTKGADWEVYKERGISDLGRKMYVSPYGRSFVEEMQDDTVQLYVYPDWYSEIKSEGSKIKIDPGTGKYSKDGKKFYAKVGGKRKLIFKVPVEAPALALVEEESGRWRQHELTAPQHEVVNEAFKRLRTSEYELSEDDEIYKEVAAKLSDQGVTLEVYIHSPPRKVLFDLIYKLAGEMGVTDFPAREHFRLITHPGTGRTGKDVSRSCNLLIPREELEFIKTLKRKDSTTYKQWLGHEVEHLLDRVDAKRGTETPEGVLSEDDNKPVGDVIKAYAENETAKRESLEYLMKDLLDNVSGPEGEDLGAACDEYGFTEPQSLFLYAEDILDNPVLLDFGATLKMLKEKGVLRGSSIVVYTRKYEEGEDGKKKPLQITQDLAAGIQALMGSETEVILIGQWERDQLLKKNTPSGEVEELVGVAKAMGVDIKNILAIVRQNGIDVPEAFRDYKVDAPLVIINNSVRGLFSFAQAMNEAVRRKIKLRDNPDADPSAWIIILKPIRKITEAIYSEYIRYREVLIRA